MEPNFYELYAALGDRDAQEAIREKHEDVKHCPMLRFNANACTGCANNPYERDGAPVAHLQAARPILEEAMRLHDLAELGLLAEPLHVLALELVRVARADALRQRMHLQARLIADEVGDAFFGKTP